MGVDWKNFHRHFEKMPLDSFYIILYIFRASRWHTQRWCRKLENNIGLPLHMDDRETENFSPRQQRLTTQPILLYSYIVVFLYF